MPELLFETKVLQTMLRNFGNETRSSALLQSLVAHPRGIVLQGERNRASLTVESQGDRTENVTEEFRGRFRILLEGTHSNTIIYVVHKIVFKLKDLQTNRKTFGTTPARVPRSNHKLEALVYCSRSGQRVHHVAASQRSLPGVP